MSQDYLIIYDREGVTCHAFLETEEELLETMEWCGRRKYEIIFASKIVVIKDYLEQ